SSGAKIGSPPRPGTCLTALPEEEGMVKISCFAVSAKMFEFLDSTIGETLIKNSRDEILIGFAEITDAPVHTATLTMPVRND
ncbi:MAG: hypothetical protein AAFV59_17195, partial [Pseudomonadota bacterium]